MNLFRAFIVCNWFFHRLLNKYGELPFTYHIRYLDTFVLVLEHLHLPYPHLYLPFSP